MADEPRLRKQEGHYSSWILDSPHSGVRVGIPPGAESEHWALRAPSDLVGVPPPPKKLPVDVRPLLR